MSELSAQTAHWSTRNMPNMPDGQSVFPASNVKCTVTKFGGKQSLTIKSTKYVLNDFPFLNTIPPARSVAETGFSVKCFIGF